MNEVLEKERSSSSVEGSNRATKRSLEWRRLQRLLGEHLAAFLGQQTSGLHTLKKLSSADSKNLFCSASSTATTQLPSSTSECWAPTFIVS